MYVFDWFLQESTVFQGDILMIAKSANAAEELITSTNVRGRCEMVWNLFTIYILLEFYTYKLFCDLILAKKNIIKK